MLLVSYFSNLAGCLVMVGLMVGGQVYAGREAFMLEVAEHKLTLGWGVVLVRGACVRGWVERGGWRGAPGAVLLLPPHRCRLVRVAD